MKKINYKCAYTSVINNREFGKPNEDRIVCDERNGVFAVFDGVTRPHEEYKISGNAAADVAEILCDSVLEYSDQLGNSRNVRECEERIKALLLKANKKVFDYNSQKDWKYKPSAVGIAAVIIGKTLVFAYVGDCAGFLIRNGESIEFSRQQTGGVKRNHLNKEDMYLLACNNAEYPFGYGLFDGDENVDKLLAVSHINLEKGDTVCLCSDGLYAFMKYQKFPLGIDAKQIIDSSTPFDEPPFASYADDKSIIIISF